MTQRYSWQRRRGNSWRMIRKLLEEKLGRSHEQQTHTVNNSNTSFEEEEEETKGRAKNFK